MCMCEINFDILKSPKEKVRRKDILKDMKEVWDP